MRYIIGLLPLIPTPYVKVAEELFADVSDGYLLSETVHPHITLAQFESDDLKLVELIWTRIIELKIDSMVPKLIGFSIIKGLAEHKDFYWAQIAVEREPLILQLHFQILDLLKQHQLSVLIDSGDIYKPHITLARIKLQKSISIWPENILDSSVFKLSLGASDQNGRYIQKIYEMTDSK